MNEAEQYLNYNTPRVNGELIQKSNGSFINENVRVVGKALEQQGDKTVFQLSDGGTIFILNLNHEGNFTIFEVIGTLISENELNCLFCTVLNDEFNLENYDRVVQFSHRYSEMFR
eukprot:TRINITY_DN19316_c0_g1_i1.p1 TRINITY_DN19316_c0_g1~~TRINITY_DN19316_c0_g1_i1.p1  ORF type:complete len:115 (-),score=14.52 TRINITY_DN19316_c0_g1_i1:70-414(-)